MHSSMELKVSLITSCLYFLLLSFNILPQSFAQQAYVNNLQLQCNDTNNIAEGYICYGPQTSCKSFVTFRSNPPYNDPITIAYLLGSEASEIAQINNITTATDKIPSEKLIVAPVYCSCSGNYYQHTTPYTIRKGEYYFSIANDTYQGLTTCQAMMSQNPYKPENISVGAELRVPIRCACPTARQIAKGFNFLLTYMVTWSDDLTGISKFASSIGEVFQVSLSDLLEANELSSDSVIYPFTPLLVPLKSESCSAQPGNYFCFCENGYVEDNEHGLKCKPDGNGFPLKWVIVIGVGFGSGLLCLVLFIYWLYRCLKRRKYLERKRRLFEQNGGKLLYQQLSSTSIGSDNTKIFIAEDLERATDNYDQNRVLGRGGYGTVYKGMLLDGHVVAVKKAKAVEKNDIQQFINEVVLLSQINHRNVVKLLGCCLETEVPLLVYEYIPNGTLFSHIRKHEDKSLSWEDRVRIASEVAGALAYMHSAASVPIFHRDVKSSNILLDEKFSAKVSDFGTSRTVPLDRTHFTTAVRGTFGYLDPEYFLSGQYTDKSDVYSFGVVLVELLTGEAPIRFGRGEHEANLASYFVSALEEGQLLQVIDPRVFSEATEEEINEVAVLAKSCLSVDRKSRPSMKEVALDLEGVRKRVGSFQNESVRDESLFRQHTVKHEECQVSISESYSIPHGV